MVTSSLPCVLRLTRQSDNYTIELPWHPAYSPRNVRLRLIRGEQYQATLSRVPLGSGFTTDGFWWADLDFAVPPGIETLGLPPTTANDIMTRQLGTVCARSPVRELPPWVVPGYADLLAATLAAWKIEIEEPELFCHGSTTAELLLTEDSLYEGIIEWRGLPPVEVRTGNPLEFDPSAVPPGRYTVTASAALNPLVADVAEVEIVNIGVATDVVWLSTAQTNSYDIALSDDTYPPGGVYVWSEPEGIYSRNITPADLTSDAYTVYLTHGMCGVAQIAVNVLPVQFEELSFTNNFTIKIKGDGPGNLVFPETTATVSGNDVTISNVECSANLNDTDLKAAFMRHDGFLVKNWLFTGLRINCGFPVDANGNWVPDNFEDKGTTSLTLF